MHYRPLTCLAIIVACLALPPALLWDRGLGTIPVWLQGLSKSLASADLPWAAAVVARAADDLLTQSMMWALAVLLLYAFLQLVGVWYDRAGLGGGTIAWLTGRPAGIARKAKCDPQRHAYHFGYGRDSLLGPLRFGQIAFPIIGFIGTVIGISSAVGHLPEAVTDGQIDDGGLRQILAGLHVAFDTTFAGLTASVLLMIVLYFLDDAWERNEAEAMLGPEPRSQPGQLSR